MEENIENVENDAIKPPKGIRGIGHKIKGALKNGLKNLFKRKPGKLLKNIFARVMFVVIRKVLIYILPIILIVACLWYVISDAPVKAAASGVSNYFETSTNISSKEVAEYYQKNASLLLVTKEDIKNISDEYLKDIQSRSASLYEVLSNETDVGAHQMKSIPNYSDFEYGNVYEYILNTEKINFNKINWRKFVRGEDKGNVELVKDDKTNLKYPNEANDNMEMIDFVDMIRPYVQTWLIPFSMLSGRLTETSSLRDGNFVYEIVENAAHNIEIEQHTLQNITRYKTTDNYRTNGYQINIYKKTFEETYTKEDGSAGTRRWTEHAYITGEVVTEISETVDLQIAEIAIDSEYASRDKTIGSKIEYVFSKAEMYDNVQQNKYAVVQYNTDNVEKKIEYDSSRQVKSVDYLVITGLDSYTKISQQSDWEFEKTVNYTVRDGTYITDELVWNDKLTTEKAEAREYTTEDVASYVQNATILDATADDYTTKKQQMADSDILTKTEKDYYKEIEDDEDDEDDVINRIDLINAVNSTRPEAEQFKNDADNHIGYSRKALATSYSMLERYLTEMVEKHSLRLMYGTSIIDEINQAYDYGVYYGFIWPVPIHVQNGLTMSKQITSDYVSWRAFDGRAHWAIDIGHKGQKNIDIVASKAGEVITSTFDSDGYGNYVILKHGDGYFSLYAHMANGTVKVKKGDYVAQGQVLGTMGTTGFSEGVHLHWEIRKGEGSYWNAERQDPKSFFNEDCSPKGNAAGLHVINQIVAKAKQMAEAKQIAYSQSAREVAFSVDKLDTIKKTDCSGFISSLYSAYMETDISGDAKTIKAKAEKGAVGNGWTAIVGEYKGNVAILQPGDLLFREGHIGMYVGDGKQVDHGGPGGVDSEANPSWKGPVLRDVDSSYTHYIRYANSGLSAGVENFDAKNKPVNYAAIDSTLDLMADREILARIIYGEQGGQSFESQVLVGISLLNRVERNNSSIKGIAKSKYTGKNGKQYYHYNCVADDGFWKKIPDYCINAADKAIQAKSQGTYMVQDIISGKSVNAIDVYGFYATTTKDKVKSVWNNWNLRVALYNENSSNKYTAYYYVPW